MAGIVDIECENVKDIEDYHKKLGTWNDYNGHGKGDKEKVSCKQVGESYDELLGHYQDKYMNDYSEEVIAKLMCECCKDKANGFHLSNIFPSFKEFKSKKNQWVKFDECIQKKLKTIDSELFDFVKRN